MKYYSAWDDKMNRLFRKGWVWVIVVLGLIAFLYLGFMLQVSFHRWIHKFL